ncbi:MAG TPA: hypothetical protein VGX25_17385 [Actinophytocola sp.]|uniref:hypothetical protein n=1 Tax=Actinophytocola sp. TaxID=1872138 RepID=UPI002DDCE6C0|nr:hypothetical protein [Actinophytocola sp.]HEV2781161.1 hypothetical protein [Actinophytocola sp.]
MSDWQFDADRFAEEVLNPVQQGWRPAEDLFRVYLLAPDVTDAATVRAALDRIGRELNNQKYRHLRRACDLLRAQHEEATAILTDPARRNEHRTRVKERTRKLGGSLRQRLHGAPGLPAAEVCALAQSSKGAFTRTTIRAALAEIGARELDPVALPDTPEPGRWTELRGLLVQLRHDSLWEYLDSVLAGLRTTPAHIKDRRERLRVSRDAASNAETTILKLVEQWITAGEMVAVLRHEVLATLADMVHYGYAEVARVAATIVDRLPRLGLPTDPPALTYAVWCRHRIADADREPGWHDDYRAAIRELRLRHALTVLEAQPGLSDEWQAQRAALTAQLSTLDDELARCRALERTDVEAAVAGYHRIRERLADPEVDAAIERCRPAEPRSATAVVRDGRVVVSWRPSPATAGRIGYRVTRDGTVVSAETRDCEVVDEDPPGGTPLTYAVHTLRDGTPSARPARTAAVTVLREVLELELRGEPNAITGRWRLPAGATGADVTRDGSPLRDTGSTGFADRNVQPGRSYTYVVRANYRLTGGTLARSDGRHATASCQEIPAAVTDLVAELDADEVVARWTPPPRGEVEVLELRPGMDPPDQGVVSVATARNYGGAVRATGPGGRGLLRGRLGIPGKRQILLPVTVLGELAAIGTPCLLDVRHGSVRALRLRRLGGTVRLTWQWPAGATAARVVWRTGARPAGPTDPEASVEDVTRVTYESRGVSLPVPPGDHWFGVCTALTDGGELSFGPLVLMRESTTATVNYTVERHRWPRPRNRRVLVVAGEAGRELPAVVLIAKTGVRPLHPDDGEQLLRTDAGPAPLRVEFTVPARLGRPVYLRAFSSDDRLVLVPARPDQLVLT